MTACAILLGLFAILKFTPHIAMARWLSCWCVEKPAAMLNHCGRVQLIGGTALMILICVLVHAEAGEALHLLGMASPEIVMLLSTFELNLYADLMMTGILAWSAKSNSSVRSTWSVRRWIGAPRQHRRRRRTKASGRKAANDDGSGDWRIAA